jgi:hypothetical protein
MTLLVDTQILEEEMMGIKVAAVGGIFSWIGALTASVTQVVVGEDTLVPLGVAAACVLLLIGAAVKVTRWVDSINNRLKDLEDDGA